MTLKRVVLASTSEIRRQMLVRAGVEIEVCAPDFDEERARAERQDLEEGPLALALAQGKALSVKRDAQTLVIGADQLLVLDGEVKGKVATMEEARRRLGVMRGKAHLLVGGVVLTCAGEVVWQRWDKINMVMRAASDAFLDAYCAAEGESLLASVGCYRYEGRGAQLFERVEGDMYGVLGMSLVPLLQALRTHGGLAV